MIDKEKREGLITGLRELADWLEANPEVKTPHFSDFNIWSIDREQFIKQAHLIGSGEKRQAYGYLMIEKRFGALTFALNIQQASVCTRIQVGERDVPARAAVAAHTEPIYEWECPESLMKEDA